MMPALNDSPLLIRALADLVLRSVGTQRCLLYRILKPSFAKAGIPMSARRSGHWN